MRFRNNQPISGLGGGAVEVQQKRRYAMSTPPGPDPEPPSVDPADFVAFAAAWQALAEPTHEGMAQDENMQREMILATGILANRADCTHVAVQDGDWTTAATWLNVSTSLFEVPTAGAKIGIPSGITVTMDNNTTTAYDTMRIDGDLIFAIDQDTKLYIDTIVVNHSGTWTQGTAANPIPSTYTSEVVFPDNGDIDTTLVTGDYLLLGRGLICMGDYTVHGAAKDHWADTNQSLSAGATSVTLNAAPTGWEDGDELQIMATDVYSWASTSFPLVWSAPRVDNVTISAGGISGSTITFSPATSFAHSVPTATGMTDLVYKVVNFTRNIRYYSPPGTAVHHRGHVMIMHGACDVRWASYDNLGRTRKGYALSEASLDATNDTDRIDLMGSDIAFAANSNVRGRYNFHIHRIGVDDGAAVGTVWGISCTEAPGWLIAHHQSNANFTACVGRGFLGSGMVAEVGSEGGTWKDCYMGEGRQTDFYVGAQKDKQEHLENTADGTTVIARPYAGDFGRNNNAYWFKGRAIVVDGCVANGCQRGFTWANRGNFGEASSPNPAYTPEPRVFYGYRTVTGAVNIDTPVLIVKNCLIVGVEFPIIVIKESPEQGHSLRTHIHSNDMWNNEETLEFEYTGHYTVDNNRLLRTSRNTINRATIAMKLQQSAAEFYISNNVVQGYPTVAYKFVSTPEFPTMDHGNVVINDHTTDATTLLSRSGTTPPGGFDVSAKTFEPGDYSDVDPTWTPAAEPVFPNAQNPAATGQQWFQFYGDMTTEFETRNRTHEAEILAGGLYNAQPNLGLRAQFDLTSLQLMLTRYGYYTYDHPIHGAGQNYLLVPDLISRKLPTTPGGDIPVRYLTVPVRLTGVSLTNYTNQGALPQRYVDCIALGDPGIADPGSPAAGAAAYVVYEDIFGAGNLYEGL